MEALKDPTISFYLYLGFSYDAFGGSPFFSDSDPNPFLTFSPIGVQLTFLVSSRIFEIFLQKDDRSVWCYLPRPKLMSFRPPFVFSVIGGFFF